MLKWVRIMKHGLLDAREHLARSDPGGPTCHRGLFRPLCASVLASLQLQLLLSSAHAFAAAQA